MLELLKTNSKECEIKICPAVPNKFRKNLFYPQVIKSFWGGEVVGSCHV